MPLRRAGKGTTYLCLKLALFVLLNVFIYFLLLCKKSFLRTHAHICSRRQWRYACLHTSFFFSFLFFPRLLLEALSGRLLVDPLGFLLAFEIISLLPAVESLGTSAERQRVRESPESHWGCSLNSSTILTVSNCLIFTLVNLSARPYSERLTHTPLPSEGLLQMLTKEIITTTSQPFTQTHHVSSKLCKHLLVNCLSGHAGQ